MMDERRIVSDLARVRLVYNIDAMVNFTNDNNSHNSCNDRSKLGFPKSQEAYFRVATACNLPRQFYTAIKHQHFLKKLHKYLETGAIGLKMGMRFLSSSWFK